LKKLLFGINFSYFFFKNLNKRMAPEETLSVRKLARLCLGLTLGSALVLASAIALVVLWQGGATSDMGLSITVAFLAAMSGTIAGLIFWSRGGAASHHAYLSVLLPVLYVFTLFVMYLGVKLAEYVTHNLRRKKLRLSDPEQFIFATISFWLAGSLAIVSALRLPRLMAFLKDFKELPRSRTVRLNESLFLRPEDQYLYFSKLDQNEINEL